MFVHVARRRWLVAGFLALPLALTAGVVLGNVAGGGGPAAVPGHARLASVTGPVYPNPSAPTASTSWAQSHSDPAACTAAEQVTPAAGTNLIANPGAEGAADPDTTAGTGTGQTPVAENYPDCWTVTSTVATPGAVASADAYGAYDAANGITPGYATVPPVSGTNFFAGGYGIDASGESTFAFQTIDLASLSADPYFGLSAWLGGQGGSDDTASVTATFEDASGNDLGSSAIGPVTPAERGSATEYKFQQTYGAVPSGATQVLITVQFEDVAGGTQITAMADNLGFVVSTTLDSLITPVFSAGHWHGRADLETGGCATAPGWGATVALNSNLISDPGAEHPFTYAGTLDGSEWPAYYPTCWVTATESTSRMGGIVVGSYASSPVWDAQAANPPAPTTSTSGSYFFGGGYYGGSATSAGMQAEAYQLIDVSSIGAGGQPYELSGYLGGLTSFPDPTTVTATYLDALGNTLGTAEIGPATSAQRLGQTGMTGLSAVGTVPDGTARILVTLEMDSAHGAGSPGTFGLADDLSLEIGDSLPPPLSEVVQLPYRDDVECGITGTNVGIPGVSGLAAGNGTVYLSATLHNVVAKLSGGSVSPVAGSCTAGYGDHGDGGPASSATLYQPAGIAVDSSGDLFIADGGDNAVREVLATGPDAGTIVDVAGDGTPGRRGVGGPATSAELDDPQAVAVDSAGDVFIADTDNNRVLEVPAGSSDVVDYAGTGRRGYSGNSGPASRAELNQPAGLAVDSNGNLYIADTANGVIRRVDAKTHQITTVVGEPGPMIAVDPAGDLYVADQNGNAIREITPAGTVSAHYGAADVSAMAIDPSTGVLYYATTVASATLYELTGVGVTLTPAGAGPVGEKAAYGTPPMDGTLDPIWNKAPGYDVTAAGDTATSPISAVTRFLWDRKYLYVLTQVQDDTPYSTDTAGDGGTCHTNLGLYDDSVDLWVNWLDNATASYSNATGTAVDVTRSGETATNFCGSPGSDLSAIKSSVVSTSTGYTVEEAVPWPKGVRPGSPIGVNISVNDVSADNQTRTSYITQDTFDAYWTTPADIPSLDFYQRVHH